MRAMSESEDVNILNREITPDGRVSTEQTHQSDKVNLEEWFQEYEGADGNQLSEYSNCIRAVLTDELSTTFVEQRIREATEKAQVVGGFCSDCRDLLDHWPTFGGSLTSDVDTLTYAELQGLLQTVVRVRNTFELEAYARSGCRFCTFCLQSLKDSQSLNTFRKIEARLYCLEREVVSTLTIKTWGVESELLWLNLPRKISYDYDRNGGIFSGMICIAAFLPISADCYHEPRDVFDLARQWLSDCSENHELCKHSDDFILPTRLISLGNKTPFLVMGSDCPLGTRYATLSHCWGSRDITKLKIDCLESFKERIPTSRISRTFNDALMIARQLGLEYLWIDTLCIIQDSEEDWQKESSLMSSVYGNSTINIAASSARDGSQGCFLKPSVFSGGFRARITNGREQRVQQFWSLNLYNISAQNTYLASRAWTLQEKMLAPRTIHWGDRGAFWECRMKTASEYLPDGYQENLVHQLMDHRRDFEKIWLEAVSIFTAANLTFAKDKLPAIAGIAQLGHSRTKDQYFAGLWRDKLAAQLCWHRLTSDSVTKRPPWRAPSWSWASIDGQIKLMDIALGCSEVEYVHVLDISTTKHGDDPFGQVTDGVLRLACSNIVTGHYSPRKRPDALPADERRVVIVQSQTEEREFSILLDCLDDIRDEDGGRVHLVPIFAFSFEISLRDDLKSRYYIQGLVLRATGTKKGQFSRIGWFSFCKNGRSWSDVRAEEDAYDPFLQVLKHQGIATAQALCADVISDPKYLDNRYVIYII